MFLGKRKEVLKVLQTMGNKLCVYAGGPWPRYCDCKYGGPNLAHPGNEDSGCPELASIYVVVDLMTDIEWAAIAKRGDHGFADDAIETVLGEMNEVLFRCQCQGVPRVQPCGTACKYPYTDEKVGGGTNC
ncbi:hypothetical protein LCGC14_1904550 [marine sediment metagenome]|uniref:Uncharacterized protein n=1 Tax=marine sediment metagenome TaxID=412755 RepID=A0A0F9FVW6_9ZZZZ